jgi:hypothetical protein
MSSKFTLQALALTGILALSGLPALAADMTPATPAPGVAVQSNVKGNVPATGNSAAVGTSAKTDAKVIPGDKKDSKDIHNDTKLKDSKDERSELKTDKDQKAHEQTAKLPAVSAPAAPVSGAAGTSVQH